VTDPGVPPRPIPLPALLLVVAVGGGLGALVRYGAVVALPVRPGSLPVATLLVNVSGAFALGVLVGLRPHARWLRPFVGTGVLGGFTTFSALALEADHLLAQAPAVGVLYVALSLVLGLGAAVAGLRVAAR